MFFLFIFIFQICFFQTVISMEEYLIEQVPYKEHQKFLQNQRDMQRIRKNWSNINKRFNVLPVKYKFSYKHISFFGNITLGSLCFASVLFLKEKYSFSKNIFFVCSLGFLFLPFLISKGQAKKFHYSLTYENMLNNFEKLRAEVFIEKFFSLIDKKTIFIDYYNNFFKKTDFYTYEYDDIRKYKVLMNFFLAKDESEKKNIIKEHFEYLIKIDLDKGRDRESIFFPKNLNKFVILEFSDEQFLQIIDTYYKDRIDEIVDLFNKVYCDRRIENILSRINENILLKILLNQKLSKNIYTYIMENFRFEIVAEINKKQGEISRINEEVEFLNHFEIYENEKREIENTQKQEEQKRRIFFFNGVNLERIFLNNINNPIAFSKLIYNNFFYDYKEIVDFLKHYSKENSSIDKIAEMLSILFNYNSGLSQTNFHKDSKEVFFKIITSLDLLEDKVKKIISSELFTVLEKDFESVLSLKFCYGQTEAVKRYHELLTMLENKNKIVF